RIDPSMIIAKALAAPLKNQQMKCKCPGETFLFPAYTSKTKILPERTIGFHKQLRIGELNRGLTLYAVR
ncbi:hypothetical protein JZU71_01020, partial [bacterium]|nr:hypothetical protein [bacterium]